MLELIPDPVVAQILKLNLSMRLIADQKTVFPMLYKNKSDHNTYTVMIETGNKELWQFQEFEIELKGRVDIEYLKYRGKVKVSAIKDEPGYYKISQVRLYKDNKRVYKRVPYRRAIQIIKPIQSEGVLMNISGSGALIRSQEKIEGNSVTIEFTLLKKPMSLNGTIIEQTYNEELKSYHVRCYFDGIDHRTRKIIRQAVKEITLMAKRRLQS